MTVVVVIILAGVVRVSPVVAESVMVTISPRIGRVRVHIPSASCARRVVIVVVVALAPVVVIIQLVIAVYPAGVALGIARAVVSPGVLAFRTSLVVVVVLSIVVQE